MDPFFNVIGGFPLILLIGIVAAVYVIVQRRRRTDPFEQVDPGIGTARRVYFYVVSFVALMMAANGVVQIVQYLLESLFGSDVLSPSQTRLAVGASLAIVGLPLWLVQWRIVQRHVGELPVERRSLIRKSYIYVVLAVSVGLPAAAFVDLLDWSFRTQSFSGYTWGALIVWVPVWTFHWRLESAEGQPTSDTLSIRRLYLYLVSLATLVMMGVGLGRIMHIILLDGYEALVSVTVLSPTGSGLWRTSMRGALALSLVGALVWWAHWHRIAVRDTGSTLRQVYLYIFAVLGGMVTFLVSLGLMVYAILAWSLGATSEEAATHFRIIAGAVAALIVGGVLWLYHWTVVRREAEASSYELQGARRSYDYILSALGLGALAVAVGSLVHTSLALLVESSSDRFVGRDLWPEPLAIAITLGVIGLPLWGYYWRSVQRRVSAQGADERNAPARRIFIFAVLGAGMLAVLGSGSALLFFFLRDLLGDGLSSETLRDARPTIDILVATGIFLPYHWLVYRNDREAGPVPTAVEDCRRAQKDVTVLVNAAGAIFVQGLEDTLGYSVVTLRRADPVPGLPDYSEAQYLELAERVGDAAGQSVLLIPEAAEVRVLSYN